MDAAAHLFGSKTLNAHQQLCHNMIIRSHFGVRISLVARQPRASRDPKDEAKKSASSASNNLPSLLRRTTPMLDAACVRHGSTEWALVARSVGGLQRIHLFVGCQPRHCAAKNWFFTRRPNHIKKLYYIYPTKSHRCKLAQKTIKHYRRKNHSFR